MYRKKLRSILALSMAVVMGLTTVGASAASVSVDLGKADKWKDSKPLSGVKQVKITSGSNSGNSARSVYFTIQKYSSSDGKYVDHSIALVVAGKNAPKLSVSSDTAGIYRLELNPYGVNTTGCIASGTLSTY